MKVTTTTTDNQADDYDAHQEKSDGNITTATMNETTATVATTTTTTSLSTATKLSIYLALSRVGCDARQV